MILNDDKMSKPTVDLENKKMRYKNIEYEIVGSDTKNICLVGENKTLNQYLIHWTEIVGKRNKESNKCKVDGLPRDDCIVLNHIAHNTLSKAIIIYEEYCTQK
jgi:hypothetical protein